MYDLEKQVCILGQAKELKEFGLELDSYFVWTEEYNDKFQIWLRKPLKSILGDRKDYKQYPAPNCAEMWHLYEAILKHEKNHTALYATLDITTREMYKSKQPAAHYLADLFIHLLKEKTIKPEDLKL